jgi:rhodanese-related sulfurtransferase
VNEATSASVARTLIKMGYSKVYALKGGWREWESKGYPVEAK